MADLHRFVVRNEAEKVVGVDEGQIALALLKGQKELLSEMVQSQWGPVHLFDLCLRCDHLGMALALAAHGVPGCSLEDHHLGPFSSISRDLSDRPCNCQGWDTCRFCCWAFPVDQGTWMEDWDEALIAGGIRPVGAIPAARKAAATAMLDLCSRDMEVPFRGSPKAMARLLDIAILTGNQKAAVNLSKKCQLWPLRRWGMQWSSEDSCWEAARTALWAGAGFQDLMVKSIFLQGSEEGVPFPQAMFLKSKLEVWQKIRHLLPGRHDLWRPSNLGNELGEFFLEGPHVCGGGKKLSLDKIRAAEDAGVDLQLFFVCVGEDKWDLDELAPVTLLDVAIWCGQPDCTEACVDRGIELNGDDRTLAWHKHVLRGDSLSLFWPGLNVVPSEAQTAAAAAGRAWLKRSWKRECSQKGIALYQMMLKMLNGKSFSMGLVQEILSYSMPVPKILDQLDLWEHVGDWMATMCGGPAFVHPAAGCNTVNVEDPKGVQDNGEAEGNGEAGDAIEPDVKATEDLMTALRASRDQVPALNVDGVCLFRLTRMSSCPHVMDLLLDATGPLQPLHTRVLEAGCEVNPSWNPVKALFVPLTEGQMVELQGLAAHGYELSNEYHVLALQSDEKLIADALRRRWTYAGSGGRGHQDRF